MKLFTRNNTVGSSVVLVRVALSFMQILYSHIEMNFKVHDARAVPYCST
jgi:hypothetical protein